VLNNSTTTLPSVDKLKREIIRRFFVNVKGKKSDTTKFNIKHCGKEGHWLETQMGIKHNASNTPDLFGYEMKNATRSKTTFGDWSANYYIFKDNIYGINRDMFMKLFGKSNQQKQGRFSWSGEPCPKINVYNSYGQTLIVDANNNIIVLYDFQKDKRKNKDILIPKHLQKSSLILAKWKASSIKLKVERKFNNKGWFQCIKNKNGVYTKIVFGHPLNFEHWIKGVRDGLIFLDSGMYQGNSRNYSQWRAVNSYWDRLRTNQF